VAHSNRDGDPDKYFFQFGQLLGFAYSIGSSDLHCSNVIASCDGPVIVDTETLLSASPIPVDSPFRQPYSVLNVGVLPQVEFADDGTWFDMSAIGAWRDTQWQAQDQIILSLPPNLCSGQFEIYLQEALLAGFRSITEKVLAAMNTWGACFRNI
jgi:hypothetical protein